jgi:signal transduction histidine kinase
MCDAVFRNQYLRGFPERVSPNSRVVHQDITFNDASNSRKNMTNRFHIPLFPRLPGLSLRWKMALVFGGLFAGAMIAVSLASTFGIPFTDVGGSYGNARSEVRRDLNLFADLKKERLLNWLAERKGDCTVLAKSPGVVERVLLLRRLLRGSSAAERDLVELKKSLLSDQDSDTLTERLDAVKYTYGFYARVIVADADSGLVIGATNQADMTTDVSKNLSFQAALNSESATINVERSSPTSEPEVVVSHAVAVPSPGGAARPKPVGVTLMYLLSDEVVKPVLYSGIGLGETGDIVLADQDLTLLISPKFSFLSGGKRLAPGDKIAAEPIARGVRGEDGVVLALDYRGEPVIAAHRHIPVGPDRVWGMVVKRDQAEVFSQPRRGLAYSLIIGMIGSVLAVGLAVVAARSISKPLENLSLTAQAVESGDLRARAQVDGADEVAALAATFNSMIGRVENWRSELEEKVAARTKELTALAAELEAKNAELERFTYTVSHDLKSPLVTIKGFLGYLEQDAAAGKTERVKQDIARISGAVEKMSLLLKELLELSRIGRIGNPPEDVPFEKLAKEAVETVAGSINARGATVEIARGCPIVFGDRVRLREVIENLVDNAIKFMGDQLAPRVEIGHRRDGPRTVYYVMDNGVGIDPKYREKVFGLFERLDQRTDGTGIGLAIVKRIIEIHGGRIWIEPGIDHKGAAFCFTLNEKGSSQAVEEING